VSEPLVRVHDEGPVRWLTLNRAAQRNALDGALVDALREALRAPGGARCLAITGAGNTFSAGADLKALAALQTASHEQNLEDSRRLALLLQEIAAHPLPVVAAVNGPALGGGAGLLAACDFAFAVKTAVIGFPEVRVGFVPAIVLNFLLRLVGERTAKDLCLTGRRIDAEAAARRGLVVVVGDLDEAVADLGAEIAKASPEAVARTKRLFLSLRHVALEEGLRIGAEANADARGTDDCREGVAAFLEKREPEWKGTK